MHTLREAPDLGIPEVKPAIESIRGRWEPKMSPRRRHAILQGRLWTLLTAWAGDRGEVGCEWRFYLLAQSELPSSLVPDVAYVSFVRMPPRYGELREKPTIAPDIAVEIVSPDDCRSLLDEKVTLYLAHGSLLVAVVDPQTRTIEMHEPGSMELFRELEVARCTAYPDMRVVTTELFKGL